MAHAEPAGPVTAPPAASQQEARALFRLGRQRFQEHNYDAARALFDEAYRLSGEPAFLFNIAQAHRLAGNCPKAAATYRHFVEMDPSSVHREEAEQRIGELDRACPPQPAAKDDKAAVAPTLSLAVTAPAVPPPSPALTLSAPANGDRHERRRSTMAVWTCAGAGTAVGLVAGGLYLWNNGRYGQWKEEEARLGGGTVEGSPGELLARQEANDSRWRSIHHVDQATWVVAGVAAVLLAGAAVLAALPAARTESR